LITLLKRQHRCLGSFHFLATCYGDQCYIMENVYVALLVERNT